MEVKTKKLYPLVGCIGCEKKCQWHDPAAGGETITVKATKAKFATGNQEPPFRLYGCHDLKPYEQKIFSTIAIVT